VHIDPFQGKGARAITLDEEAEGKEVPKVLYLMGLGLFADLQETRVEVGLPELFDRFLEAHQTILTASEEVLSEFAPLELHKELKLCLQTYLLLGLAQHLSERELSAEEAAEIDIYGFEEELGVCFFAALNSHRASAERLLAYPGLEEMMSRLSQARPDADTISERIMDFQRFAGRWAVISGRSSQEDVDIQLQAASEVFSAVIRSAEEWLDESEPI
jgi:hypothetical protein